MWLSTLLLGLLSLDLSYARHESHNNLHFRRSTGISPEYAGPKDRHANDTATSDATAGFKTVAYFVNWGIYARNFVPQQLPADKLTHVNYAFADVNNETGEVILSDLNADVTKQFPTDKNETGTNLYGCLKQLNLLKRKNRQMKLLLSIGGWTLSKNIAGPANNATQRAVFARSAVGLLKDYGFDGLDVDWEYPRNNTEAQNLVELLRVMRAELSVYSRTLPDKPHFLLTMAAPAGPMNYRVLDFPGMVPYLDFINLMNYDYAGSWDTISGHGSNFFPDSDNPTATPFSSARAIKDYMAMGVPASKIVLGMPLYGKSFLNNFDGLGMPYNGTSKGSWEQGIWDYKALPLPGAQEYFDAGLGAAWSWNDQSKELVSYETVASAQQKAALVRSWGLSGAMWWEASGDKSGDQSIISAVHAAFPSIETSPNQINYPQSKYDNLRNGFPGE